MSRVPAAAIGVLLAVLVPLGFATDDGEREAVGTAPVPTIAERVERLRGLRFDRVPVPVRVGPRQAVREGLADLDRGYPMQRRRADEALYTLLGLLPPGTDLREIRGSIFGDQVAGYYDPRSGDLRVVEGAGTANRVLDEMVLAHELTHALDDQAIGLDDRRAAGSGDRATAYLAIVEGVATEVMVDYVAEHFDAETALGGLLSGAFAQGTGADLPRFVLNSLTFPYLGGQAFVTDLRRRAGGRWTLVDLAEGVRPPLSTEQVLHPAKWIAVEPPLDVRAPAGLGRTLGPGHRRLAAGVLGEWQTGELLALSGRPRTQAAAGWGGDRYELWRREPDRPCRTPCTGRDTLVMRWRWDTRADAREFAAALREVLEAGLRARPRRPGEWTLRGAGAALRERGDTVTLALAPDGATARAVSD